MLEHFILEANTDDDEKYGTQGWVSASNVRKNFAKVVLLNLNLQVSHLLGGKHDVNHTSQLSEVITLCTFDGIIDLVKL